MAIREHPQRTVHRLAFGHNLQIKYAYTYVCRHTVQKSVHDTPSSS